MSLCELRNYGVEWWHQTGRKPYINFCVTENFEESDRLNLEELFPANVFCLTLSVLCSADETMKDAGYRDLDKIREHEGWFLSKGYDTRVFDPAGQDDIGGGCGQLWYVQQYMENTNA
jgi:23S rRNA (adenine2503-C2)-methyltransferase